MLALEDYVRTPAILTGGSASLGTSIPGDIGTIMVTENACHVLIVTFPYSAKPAYSGQVGGYLFPATILEGNTLRKIGTLARTGRLVWHAIRTLDMTVTNLYGTGAMTCYVPLTTVQVASLPAIN
jgi:hypothetical protein